MKRAVVAAGIALSIGIAFPGMARAETTTQLVDSIIAECRLEEAGITEIPVEIQAAATKYGTEYAIAPELLIAMAWQESRFQRDAKGGACCGIMQVNPHVHKGRMNRLGVSDIFDIDGNMHVAADYLAELFVEYEDPGITLMAYNGATSAIKAHKVTKYAKSILQVAESLERMNGK